jgi:Cys-tRNA(Pro) deacylase
MARKPRIAPTPALRALDAAGVDYTLQPYDYVERGGARASSVALGVPLHRVIKTIVLQDADKRPLVVCMHGDREVSTKAVARHLGSRGVQPCAPDVAQRHSGYQVGGTSPFGLRKALPVFVERTILDLDRIWINGGRRGLLVALAPRALLDVASAAPIDAAQ